MTCKRGGAGVELLIPVAIICLFDFTELSFILKESTNIERNGGFVLNFFSSFAQ